MVTVLEGLRAEAIETVVFAVDSDGASQGTVAPDDGGLLEAPDPAVEAEAAAREGAHGADIHHIPRYSHQE